MIGMATKKPNPWPKKLKALQAKLGLTNQEMADRLSISLRVYVSWKWNERVPPKTGQTLINLLAAGKL